jgi:hypothetical protein
LRGKFVVVAIAYHPILPKIDLKKIEEYYDRKAKR